MRIRLKMLILGQGAGTSVVAGAGGVITDKNAAIWYENGFVWVKPAGKKDLRFYHPAHCEMYPADDAEGVPLVPGSTDLKAVAGGKK